MKFKQLFLVTIFLILNSSIFACDGCRSDFCYYAEHNKSEFIFYGEIISIDTYKATLQVLDILRGNESKNIIQIWTHKDSIVAKGTSCEELIRMTNIINMGAVNERIIIGLNLITIKENEWDVIGDYRLPLRVNNTPWLKVENDSVRGLISGGPPCYSKKELLKISYPAFKASWSNGQLDCNKLLTANFIEPRRTIIKRTANQIIITNDINSNFMTDVYNSSGILLHSTETDCECILNLNDFEKGVLIIKAYNQKGTMLVEKILNK
jgi:hypothetical protein